VETGHVHAPEAACTPACRGWAEGALHLFYLQQRWPEMLEACRAAASVEHLVVAPAVAGVVLPEWLREEELVRLNTVVGRDTPELALDVWGVRCNLTFRGRRVDCAFPWPSVVAGLLRPPERARPRFGVIQGGKKD
jgi:hypothetical protein